MEDEAASQPEEGDGTAAWQEVEIPAAWKQPPSGPLSDPEGFAWYRAVVVPPDSWNDQPLRLFVEAVDDAREVFFNGHRAGALGTFPPEYRSGLGASSHFPISSQWLLPGEPNLVAIRVYRYDGRRGFNVAAPVLFAGDQAIRMEGTWQAVARDTEEAARLSGRFAVDEANWFRETMPAEQAQRDLLRLAADEGPLAPPQSLERIEVADDLAVDLVLHEPAIGQPLSIKWDARGRMWVAQYLQYPDPAGLKAVSRDHFLRTVWDKTPAPPPHHFPGADRITVHEDTTGDGVYDHHHTFVEGLSLASSFALDHEGLWVLSPPYLLFYPDRDGDGVADGDPEVHLEGFGLEDAHSVANSLRWGPDGWLYAAQGSTVSANVRPFGSEEPPVRSIGQLIWRYHPPTRRYEIFSEGGGNAFGVEFDSAGRVFSGHNGGDTRGFHYLQGAYFRKGFGKHGELSNPYSFGFFEPMAHHRVERFTHHFVIQESESLPERFRHHLFGIEPLQGRVVMSEMMRDGATFQTKDIEHVLTSGDSWFRPVDLQEGPDGALYIADFYEQRIDHASHMQGRVHRESGRIYRLRGRHADPAAPVQDLSSLETDGLVDRLASPVRWQRETALRLLVERQDDSARERLTAMATDDDSAHSVDALWAIERLGGLDVPLSERLLRHARPEVRRWTVRLWGDRREVPPQLLGEIVRMAAGEADPEVRVQLAATARRLPVSDALAIVSPLLGLDGAAEDNRLPLMLWWALESKIGEDAPAVVEWFTRSVAWEAPLVQRHLLERMMRRFAAPGSRRDLAHCATLLRSAEGGEQSETLLRGFEAAYRGRSLASLPDDLLAAMSEVGGGSLPLRVRRGESEAIEELLALVQDDDRQADERAASLEVLGDVRPPGAREVLLSLATEASAPDGVRIAALGALQGYGDTEIAPRVLEALAEMPPRVHESALTLLASRPHWSEQLVERVDRGAMAADSVAPVVVRKILLHRNDALRASVEKHWGTIEGATTAEMEEAIDHYSTVLASGAGNPRPGKQLFRERCGACHQLFGEGGENGPDLTSYQRDDLRHMLIHVVNPSLEIREGYETHLLLTEDGRALSGLLADADPQVVVLRDADGQTRVVPRDEIVDLAAVPRSIMPEGLLEPLSDQQLRDLFAYLRSPQPIP